MAHPKDNVYSTPVPSSVTALMDVLTFPHLTSVEVLDGLDFDSLLDIGAGKDTRLARYVDSRGARYAALDRGVESDGAGRDQSFAAAMGERLQALGIDADLYQGDARALSRLASPVDVCHTRFMLMHMTAADRRSVLDQMLAVARRHVVMLDYSWRTMASQSHPALMQRFVDHTFELMAAVGADPFIGEALAGLAEEAGVPYRAQTFALPEADHRDQLDLLCRLESDLARGAQRPDLAAVFDETLAAVEGIAPGALQMTSATIHAVVIDRAA